jgi:hypothetical protein
VWEFSEFCRYSPFWLILAITFIQNHWVSGLRPSSSILKSIKYSILETGSISILRWGGKRERETDRQTATLLGPLESANLNSDPIFQNVVFSSFYNIGWLTKSRNPMVLRYTIIRVQPLSCHYAHFYLYST